MKKPETATRLITAGRKISECSGSVNPPVYRTSTIIQPTLEAWYRSRNPGYDGFTYGRKDTPTTRALEEAISELYGGGRCISVCSGVAAVAVALLGLVKAGDHILVTDSVFGPTRVFCNRILADLGIDVEYYDPAIGSQISTLVRCNTVVIYTESPGSLTFEVQDIPAIVAAARTTGVKVVIDNTWATSLFFNPFEHGVDVVIEAATKYVAGHSDVLMGIILAKGELGNSLYEKAKVMGMCSGSEELYLAQRGLRTLALRLNRSGKTAMKLAEWLLSRPEVTRVFHPALPDNSGYKIWKRDFSGSSGLFSFLLRPAAEVSISAFFNNLRLFGIGASWGGFESLILPADLAGLRTSVKWSYPGFMVRVYAGLEDYEDLKADLSRGFECLARANKASFSIADPAVGEA